MVSAGLKLDKYVYLTVITVILCHKHEIKTIKKYCFSYYLQENFQFIYMKIFLTVHSYGEIEIIKNFEKFL
jgi:hypothetical protein